MPELPLSPDERRRVVTLLAERAGLLTPLARQNFLEDAELEAFATQLDFATDARTFAQQLVRVLQGHGTLAGTGQPALLGALAALRERVAGHEVEAAFVDGLLGRAGGGEPQAEAPTAPDSATLRALLTAAFSDGELTTLCFDHFRAVYEDFGEGMAEGQKIQRLMEHCERKGEVTRLLTVVQQANPAQYRRFLGDG